MSYKIILDSCGELPKELQNDPRFERVPLGLEVGDYCIMDDEAFDQKLFLEKVAACPTCPKSSCPSPQRYMEAYHCEADHVYVVTLSSKLSGSYNSAELGRRLYEETYGNKDIMIIDSRSASGGETQIALLAMELEEKGLDYDTICKKLTAYRNGLKTYFILDNLETLRKNGRLSNVKALIASTLNIKPVMGADMGSIIQLHQCIGFKKALHKLADTLCREVCDPEKKRVIITHCNASDRAELLKKLLMGYFCFKEILIEDTAGVSSMYANDGGVIVAV
ncbi:MAG: DegV family protein [Clostridium sp.]|nr:DegV family protein [Clostridium sp.]